VGSEDQYQDLEARIAEMEHQLEDTLSEFSSEDFESVFGAQFSDYPEFS
jgi:tetrahydromethanopterin S-methyltransferase subunit G